MRHRRKRQLVRRLGLALAVAAMAAPAGQAALDGGGDSAGGATVVRPDDRAVHGVVAAPRERLPLHADDKVLAPSKHALVRGDDKVLVPPPSEVLVRGDDKVLLPTSSGQYSLYAYRRALPQDRYEAPLQVVSASRPDGFDWGDAGIGAATMFGAMLLAAGFTLAARHHPSRSAAA